MSPVLELGQPILTVAIRDDGHAIVAAARDRWIYRSDDGGRTWPGG